MIRWWGQIGSGLSKVEKKYNVDVCGSFIDQECGFFVDGGRKKRDAPAKGRVGSSITFSCDDHVARSLVEMALLSVLSYVAAIACFIFVTLSLGIILFPTRPGVLSLTRLCRSQRTAVPC